MSGRVVALAVLIVGASGCGVSWRRVPLESLDQVTKRQVVDVWRQNRRVQLHGVRMTADTVFGVPFFQSPDCDSCRIAFERRDVDSVRLGDLNDAINRPVRVLLWFWIAVGFLVLACRETCRWTD